MSALSVLEIHREAVCALALRFNTRNPRVFGPMGTGVEQVESELELVVDPLPQTTLLDLGGLQVALEELLGVPVDVCTPNELPASVRERVLAQARAV